MLAHTVAVGSMIRHGMAWYGSMVRRLGTGWVASQSIQCSDGTLQVLRRRLLEGQALSCHGVVEAQRLGVQRGPLQCLKSLTGRLLLHREQKGCREKG